MKPALMIVDMIKENLGIDLVSKSNEFMKIIPSILKTTYEYREKPHYCIWLR